MHIAIITLRFSNQVFATYSNYLVREVIHELGTQIFRVITYAKT